MLPAQHLAGVPGHLSRHEETTLKDMWRLLLNIFGIHALTPDSDSATSGSANGGSITRKNSRWYKSSSDGKDKYGLWKAYQEAIDTRSPDELRHYFWSMAKHEHPDVILCRYLRAYDWDVRLAIIALIAVINWRANEILLEDDLMFGGEEIAQIEATSRTCSSKRRTDGSDFMAQLRMGKAFFHGKDRDGRPCVYVRVRLHRIGAQTRASLERFIIWTFEHARFLLDPAGNGEITIVFDLTDFTLANMDYTPVKLIIKGFECYYPSLLGHVLIYRAPAIFRTCWPIIRAWLDPRTAAKVSFVKNVREMERFLTKDNILREMDGDSDWAFAYEQPTSDENATMADIPTRNSLLDDRNELYNAFELSTLAWISSERDRKALSRAQTRERVAVRLERSYWSVDPYIRARSIFDRMGMLGYGKTPPDLWAGGVKSDSVDAHAAIMAAAEQNRHRRHQGESQTDIHEYQGKHALRMVQEERVDEMYS